MDINLLLNQIISIRDKYETIYKKTGGLFNIFDISGIAHDEVKICKVLTEILDPKGSHFQGDIYLRKFINIVLNMNLEEKEYDNINVYREYLIDENRRIDIVIKSNNYFIPIEVKIYAGDQEKQCYDYFKCAEKNSKEEVKVYYLTLDRHLPSTYSTKGLTPISNEENELIGYREIKLISFKEDIIKWLEACLSDEKTIKIASIREVIIQLINIFKKYSDFMESDEQMEVIDTIMKSKENMQSAYVISENMQTAKQKMMEKIFKDIELRMNKLCVSNNNLYIENKCNYYIYDKQINSYYDKKESSYPGLNYVCKNVTLKDNIQLWFRIEIDYILCAGYCLYDTKNNTQLDEWDDNLFKEIRKQTSDLEKEKDNWWVFWDYIPNQEKTPNFNEVNEILFKLYDKNYYDKFIEECIGKIEELLKKL